MMVTLGLTMWRGRVWAGGTEREGKADDRKKSWKVLLVGETGRTWARQQARDLFIAHLAKQKLLRMQTASPFHYLEFSHVELQSF